MTNIDNDALEDLLRQASPRPAPSVEDVAGVRETVRAEWRDLTARRRSRQRAMQYAIAATVLVGAFFTFNLLRTPVVDIVQVATIEKSIGPVYVLAEQAVLRETTDLSTIIAGQTIVTGDGAGLALAWENGGSVRIDANSRVEFSNDTSVYLDQGRIYFDSMPAALVADADARPEFELRTEFGKVSHTGTQYMTEVTMGGLIVSVREGEVSVDGPVYDRPVISGQQLTMSGRQRPSVLRIGRSGQMWNWVNRITPPVDVEGRSAYDFLIWVSREMGLELNITDAAAEEARRASLKGTINAEPAAALRARMATAALDWRIEEGVIYISRAD